MFRRRLELAAARGHFDPDDTDTMPFHVATEIRRHRAEISLAQTDLMVDELNREVARFTRQINPQQRNIGVQTDATQPTPIVHTTSDDEQATKIWDTSMK